MRTMPYAIRTERLHLRCWDPRDAEGLLAVSEANRGHLSPWIPAKYHEPQTIEEKVDLLREFRGRFDLGEDFVYGIFDEASGSIVGGSGLHLRHGPGVADVGYWLVQDAVGKGYATEAAGAVVRAGFEFLELARIEIRCDPENPPSRRVAEALGFQHEATLRGIYPAPSGSRIDTEVHGMLRAGIASSPVGERTVTFADAIGRPVEERAAGRG